MFVVLFSFGKGWEKGNHDVGCKRERDFGLVT